MHTGRWSAVGVLTFPIERFEERSDKDIKTTIGPMAVYEAEHTQG